MNNMSNGTNAGIVLAYVKEGTLYPIALSEEQLQALDLLIPMALNHKVNIINSSIGKVVNLCKEKKA